MGQFDSIHTGRLLLRRWRESDREPFAELNGDPQTLVFFPQTLDRAASDALIDRIEANFEVLGYGLWALEVKETGRFIGFTGLAPMPADVPGAGGVEIGWRLARHAWHHGYATEAARRRSVSPSTACAWPRSGRSPPCSTSPRRRSCAGSA